MNNDQRKFLIGQVENTCKEQVEKLNKKMPERPSLNNYLIAAFLDGSIQFGDIEALKSKLRARVLKMGASEALIKEKSESWSNRREGREKQHLEIDPEDLFVIPDNYLEALNEYQRAKEEIDTEIEKLEGPKENNCNENTDRQFRYIG